MLHGIGAGLNSCSTMSLLIAHSSKEDREANIGLLEVATGLGLLLGPLNGSLLHRIGGYSLPFTFNAGCFAVLLPAVIVQFRRIAEAQVIEEVPIVIEKDSAKMDSMEFDVS